jgi:hypothetical protein
MKEPTHKTAHLQTPQPDPKPSESFREQKSCFFSCAPWNDYFYCFILNRTNEYIPKICYKIITYRN